MIFIKNTCDFCDNPEGDSYLLDLFKSHYYEGWQYCGKCKEKCRINRIQYLSYKLKPNENTRNVLVFKSKNKNLVEFEDYTFQINAGDFRMSISFSEIVVFLSNTSGHKHIKFSEMIKKRKNLFGDHSEDFPFIIDDELYDEDGIKYWEKQIQKSYDLSKEISL